MTSRAWIVMCSIVASLAAFAVTSCSSPEPPDAWAVERFTEDEEDPVVETLCVDVAELALGSLADQPRLTPVLDELARIGALAGATDALPKISRVETTLADTTLSEHNRFVTAHDLLVGAATALDDATSAACGIPVFSAMYATSGFPDCHFELELPIAAYTTPREPGCTTDDRPALLPCWSNDGSHLAVDCVSGVIVQTVGDDWREAGEPRTVEIDRVDPDAPPPPTQVRLRSTPACRALATLFTESPIPNGTVPDFERLRDAASGLPPTIADLVGDFVNASVDPPSLAEFEALVTELDDATVDVCGLPLVSAWATMSATAAAMPCWVATDLAYPAYEPVECTDDA